MSKRISALVLLLAATSLPSQPLQDVAQVRAGNLEVSAGEVRDVERRVAAALASVGPQFPGLRPRPFEVIVHRTVESIPPEVRVNLHEGTAGVALLEEQRIHLVLNEAQLWPPHDLQTVVCHEVVHILLHQFAGDGGAHVPRWLHEGLAQDLSGGPYLGASEEDIAFRAATSNLLMFSDLEGSFPRGGMALRVAYAQSFSFVSYLRSQVGLDGLLGVARACEVGVAFEAVFESVTGRVLIYAERDWVEYLRSGSGAAMRVLMGSCFSLLIVAALPLLVLAGRRRWNRDHAAKERLNQVEFEDDPWSRDQPGGVDR